MENKPSYFFIAFFVLVVLLLASFVAGLYYPRANQVINVKNDTIIKWDTIRDTIPQPTLKYLVKYKTDTLLVYGDTDSIYVPVVLPIERKEYKTSEYHAIVDGYKAQLSFIETYNKTTQIERLIKEKAKPRWGVGIQSGMGVGIGEKTLTPMFYIGVGVQYNFLTW